MSNQILKLRRSSVPGKIPTVASLDFGEIAINTYDGLAFIKKSGPGGELVIPIGSTGSLFGTASWANNAPPFSFLGSTIYSTDPAAGSDFSMMGSFLVGEGAGMDTMNAFDSTMIGMGAGMNATDSYRSVFIGYEAGSGSNYANNSVFLGEMAGALSPFAFQSNFIGQEAGHEANLAFRSNFIGYNAGFCCYSSSYSTIIGYRAGYVDDRATSPGRNNIIIGTNITLPTAYRNGINIGGLIFGSGSHSNLFLTNNAFSGSADGKIGINEPNPEFVLDVAGDGRFKNGLTVTGSLVAPTIIGTLQGTASWALNAISALTAQTASIALSASYFSGSITNAVLADTASFVTASNVLGPFGRNSVLTSSYSATASSADNLIIRGNLTGSNALFTGTVTAQRLVVQTVTSSVIYSSGSNQFGNQLTDSQQFTGSVTITGSLGISGPITKVDSIQFNTTASGPNLPGKLVWNDNDGTLNLGMKGGNVTLQIGQEFLTRVHNLESTTISDGQLVAFSGSVGDKIGVRLADATYGLGASNLIGMVTEAIPPGEEGFVTYRGFVRDLNTTLYLAGEPLFLDTVPGGFNNAPPDPPNASAGIGYAVIIDAVTGSVYVDIKPHFLLEGIDNVLDQSTTASWGDLLIKSGSVWRNSRALTGSYSLTGSLTVSGSLNATSSWAQNALTASYVPASGVVGLNLARISTGSVSASVDVNGDTFSVVSGSSTILYISSSRSVGINTTGSSAFALDVNGRMTITGVSSSDGGQLGPELLSATGWTTGSAWTGTYGTGFTHVVGNTTPLTNTLAAVNGTYYLVSWNVTGRTAGTFGVTFGGVTVQFFTATDSSGIRAVSSGTLSISPSSDFDGTITVSIKTVSTSNSSIQLRNSSGTTTNEVRIDASNTNIFIGLNAGSKNSVSTVRSTGNTFLGSNSGVDNITGTTNTFIGYLSGQRNVYGGQNTFVGSDSGQNNISGEGNSFYGRLSGNANISGQLNSFFGTNSGLSSTGDANSYFGASSGTNISAGSNNALFGRNSGRSISSGTSLTTLNNSVLIGFDTRPNANSETNQTVIGYQAIGLGSNTTVIGNSSTTFGRWWGNLLIGTSSNAGQALQVSGLASFTGTTGSDGGQLGAEVLPSTGWVSGSAWTGTFASGFTHVVGNITPLTNPVAAVTNTYYYISYTVTARTAGSFTIDFGGYTSGNITATGVVGPRATSTATASITPTTDFDGTVAISIKAISPSTGSIQLRNSFGTITNEIRSDSSSLNTFMGLNAGSRNLGTQNTFIGSGAGQNTTTGTSNVFVGQNAGVNNTIGGGNVIIGVGAGANSIGSFNNVLIGPSAGASITTTSGFSNTIVGAGAGNSLTTGERNCFFGYQTGWLTTGIWNSFYGTFCGQQNTTGNYNSAFGEGALANNQGGFYNTAIGQRAGRLISTGANLTTTNNSVFLGVDTRANANSETNQTVIGYQAIGLGSNTTVIGNSSTTTTWLGGNLLIGTLTGSGYRAEISGSSTSGSLNVNNTLYVSGSSLGIGISRPSASLHISASTGILLEVDSPTQNNILFITSSGQVGIGTTTTGSLYRLDISGSARVTDQLYIESASIDYQQNLSLALGSWQTIAAAATASYRAAFFDYVMFSGSIGRAGTVTTFWSASATEFYENYTEDLGGSTSGVVLQTAISASQIVLQATASSAAWTIRSLVRLL